MAQPLPVRADGTPIPWEKVSDALAKGEAGFHANEDVHVLNPATKEWRVAKGAKVGQYLGAGWTLASPAAVEAKARAEQDQAARAKRMTLVEAGKAELEGYGRGLSGGLTDVVGAAISPEWAENARQRKEVHTLPSVAGELYGLGSQVVGAGLLTGGAGAAEGAAGAAARIGQVGRVLTAPGRALMGAGRVGEAAVEGLGVTRASLAGRAALAAGRGAGEGALLGLGQGLSEASLENRPLASQKLLASIGHGFLLGGITGGLLQPAAEGVSAGGRAALEAMTGGKSLEDALEGVANRQATRAMAGNNKAIWNDITYHGAFPERADRIGQKALGLGLSANPRKAQVQVEAALKKSSDAMEELAAARSALGDVDHELPGAVTGGLFKVADEPARVIASGIDSEAARTALDLARRQVKHIRETPLGHHQDIADAIEREIRPLEQLLTGAPARPASNMHGHFIPAREAIEARTPSFAEMWKIRSELYKGINWARDSKAPQYREMKELARNFDDALTRDMDAVGAPLGGPDFGAAWRQAKEDTHDLLSMRDAYEETVQRMDKNRTFSLTDYLAGMVGFGAGPAGGLAMAYGNKLLRERGPMAMAKLLSHMAKVDTRMTAATTALLEDAPKLARVGVTAGGVRAMHKSPTDEFHARRDQLLAATQDPEKQVAGLAHAMTALQGHPDMQSDVADLYGRANAYLLRHLPKPLARTGLGLTPGQLEPKVPRSEMLEYLERARTADDPVGEIAEDLEKGRVSQVKLQTMRELYPDLFAEWGNRMQLRIAERAAAGKPLPYRRRVVLSLTFGFVGDPSLEPAKLEQTQSTHALLQQQAQAMKGSPAGAPGAATMKSNAMAVQPMKYH